LNIDSFFIGSLKNSYIAQAKQKIDKSLNKHHHQYYYYTIIITQFIIIVV